MLSVWSDPNQVTMRHNIARAHMTYCLDKYEERSGAMDHRCKCGSEMKLIAAFEKRLFGLETGKSRWQCPRCKRSFTVKTGAPAAAIREAAHGGCLIDETERMGVRQ